MKKISVGMLLLGVTSSILFAMNLDTQIMSITQVKTGSAYKDSYDIEKTCSNDLSEALQSVESLAQQFDTDLKKPYSEKSLLRATFEQKNEEILDKVSLDTLQNYLVCNYGEKSKSNDSKVPWLVNYWYDHSKNSALIRYLSQSSGDSNFYADQDNGSREIYSPDICIDIQKKSDNTTIPVLATLVKNYACSIKKMYADDKKSIVFLDDYTSIVIKNQYLRTLYGIDKIINKEMTKEQKNDITSVYFDSNKLHFPDVKRIKTLFPRLKKISYRDNPLQYIDETDVNMPVGFELDFCSSATIEFIPVKILPSLAYLKLIFNKKSLSQEQIDSIRSIKYNSDRFRYLIGNGIVEITVPGALAGVLGVVWSATLSVIHGEVQPFFFYFIPGTVSFLAAMSFAIRILSKRGIFSVYYFEHDIVLSE